MPLRAKQKANEHDLIHPFNLSLVVKPFPIYEPGISRN